MNFSLPSGGLDLTQVSAVSAELAAALKTRDADREPLIIAYRSTMYPGAMEDIVLPALIEAAGQAPGTRFEAVLNPEFLRESTAIQDYYAPLQVGLFSNAAQTRAVREGLADVDIGYSYYIRSAETMRSPGRSRARISGPVTFLVMQLSQALNTRRMAEHFRNLKVKLLYFIETRLVRNYEPRVWSEFTRAVLIGQQDVDEIAAACRDKGLPEVDNVVFGPHGVDVDRFAPRDDVVEEPFTLAFNGVLRTYTNVHAINWFAVNVWPFIRAGKSRAKLLIVGRDPRPEVIALGELDGVTVTGEVPDPADYIARVAVCINPVQVSAGMQNKLIEFMAMRKAVVVTTVANEGIRATPGDHLVIADDAQSFVDTVLALLADPARRDSLAEAARNYILGHWTWEAHFLTLEAAMLAALEDSAPPQNALSSPQGD